jgi:hypothetical protein
MMNPAWFSKNVGLNVPNQHAVPFYELTKIKHYEET